MKLQNVVFVPASEEIRQALYKAKMDFISIEISGTVPAYMIISDKLKTITSIAQKIGLKEITISDCYRETFRLDLGNKNTPTKLGKLSRVSKEGGSTNSPFFFTVTTTSEVYTFSV